MRGNIHIMKRNHILLTLALSLVLLAGCAGKKDPSGPSSLQQDLVPPDGITITDWTDHSEKFSATPQRVVALSGSLGEVWLDAGGTLVGTTDDAVKTRRLDLPEDVAIVGTILEPDLEAVLALEPDFVILGADVENHAKLAPTLEEMGIPYGLFHEEYFEDYLAMLKQFTDLTGREDLYRQNGLAVRSEIEQRLADGPDLSGKSVLLLRAYSSGVKAKGADTLAGVMLADFGLENVLDRYDSLLEDLSMEEILRIDPDYIMVTTMGGTQAALDNLEQQLCSDPAWGSLTAVKEGRFHILPKDLFHYKPNARWAEAYAHLAGLFSQPEA